MSTMENGWTQHDFDVVRSKCGLKIKTVININSNNIIVFTTTAPAEHNLFFLSSGA